MIDDIYSYRGQLYIVSAPSGAGKSSLLAALVEEFTDHPVCISISHTTRAPRPLEKDGEHYYFVSKDSFEEDIRDGMFLEYATVFDNYYGTSKKFIEKKLADGIDVFLDIDWQGARQIKHIIPYAKSIFILPPSLETLEKRLISRNQDSLDIIHSRMTLACREISHYMEYDFIVVNDDFRKTLDDLECIVRCGRQASHIQRNINKELISNFLK